jgi:hypothetical protein
MKYKMEHVLIHHVIKALFVSNFSFVCLMSLNVEQSILGQELSNLVNSAYTVQTPSNVFWYFFQVKETSCLAVGVNTFLGKNEIKIQWVIIMKHVELRTSY